jgi:hypothetical protein
MKSNVMGMLSGKGKGKNQITTDKSINFKE